MKRIVLATLPLALLAVAQPTLAEKCDSRMRAGSAYAAALNYYPIVKSLLAKPDKVKKATSQAELHEITEGLDRSVRVIEIADQDISGCLNSKLNKILTRDLGTGYGDTSGYEFSSVEEMFQRALASANETKALLPAAEERVKLATKQRQAELLQKQAENKREQEKLEAEQKRIRELELAVAKERQLKQEKDAAEQRRKQLESEQQYYASQNQSHGKIYSNQSNTKYHTGLNDTPTGDGYIKAVRVACTSEAAHDKQIDLLASERKEFAPGCFATPENQYANLIIASWGACQVERISDHKMLWIDCGDFVDR